MSWVNERAYPVDVDSTYMHAIPRESYSRQIDSMVKSQELPYGYDSPPPPADTHDYDERAYETHMQTHLKAKY